MKVKMKTFPNQVLMKRVLALDSGSMIKSTFCSEIQPGRQKTKASKTNKQCRSSPPVANNRRRICASTLGVTSKVTVEKYAGCLKLMWKSCQQKRESRFRSFHQRCSTKKVFLKFSPNSQGNTCARVSFLNKVPDLRGATLLKKETLAQVFSCEFCEISKSTFSYRTPPVAASEELIIELIAFEKSINNFS